MLHNHINLSLAAKECFQIDYQDTRTIVRVGNNLFQNVVWFDNLTDSTNQIAGYCQIIESNPLFSKRFLSNLRIPPHFISILLENLVKGNLSRQARRAVRCPAIKKKQALMIYTSALIPFLPLNDFKSNWVFIFKIAFSLYQLSFCTDKNVQWRKLSEFDI